MKHSRTPKIKLIGALHPFSRVLKQLDSLSEYASLTNEQKLIQFGTDGPAIMVDTLRRTFEAGLNHENLQVIK